MYLPVDEITPGFALSPLNFMLPGNVRADLYGWTGTNVFVPIGKQRLVFNVTGTIQDLAAADFPTLPSTGSGNVINGPSVLAVPAYENGAGGITPSQPIIAEAFRDLILKWMADIQDTAYSNIALCIKNWLGEADGRYLQVGGTITDFQGPTEKAGYPKMYEYSFTFVSGVGA